ncbi:DUF1007 family protein [Halomonas sp. TBZ9]|uniref:DUF1007 family protein n=1 Tax=Vreelandella azerica TaxID=2732867 RepID=A0A7Y3XAK8_9GAMM|nr:DUF1007 family protein [Halomonas azerica]NOG31305.1 DUF1007 family protein [Halomonas azerica]
MYWKIQRFFCVMVVLSTLLLGSPVALAHPHGWIDLSIKVISDEQGRVIALEQRWRMDPFYSLVVMEELGQVEGASMEQGLAELGHEIRDNLAPMDYFTEIHLDGKAIDTGDVSEYTTRVSDGRLVFMFRLPLIEPQPLADAQLAYQVFDPTYYLEMVHEADTQQRINDDALTLQQEMPECALSVKAADPDPEVVMRAALLDADEQGEPGLGRYFAETGLIDCR